jgi:hypothetical protein
MLGDNATSFEIEKIKEISFRSAWWLLRPQDTGANLVWMLQVEIYRSLATVNMTGHQSSFFKNVFLMETIRSHMFKAKHPIFNGYISVNLIWLIFYKDNNNILH